MFGLRRPHQSPHRRPRQIGDVLPRQTHCAPGGHHQHAGVAFGQPRLHGGQHRAGPPMGFRHRIILGCNGFKYFVGRVFVLRIEA